MIIMTQLQEVKNSFIRKLIITAISVMPMSCKIRSTVPNATDVAMSSITTAFGLVTILDFITIPYS